MLGTARFAGQAMDVNQAHASTSARRHSGAFNVLAMVAEFESDLIRMRTREGMKIAKAKGRPTSAS